MGFNKKQEVLLEVSQRKGESQGESNVQSEQVQFSWKGLMKTGRLSNTDYYFSPPPPAVSVLSDVKLGAAGG